jgi:hypothetical protein
MSDTVGTGRGELQSTNPPASKKLSRNPWISIEERDLAAQGTTIREGDRIAVIERGLAFEVLTAPEPDGQGRMIIALQQLGKHSVQS